MSQLKVGLYCLLGACGVIGVPAALAAFTSEVPFAKREMPAPQTQVAWYSAEAQNTPAAWDRAADAYEAELAICHVKCKRDAFRVVLARRYAMDADWTPPTAGDNPVEMPIRVKATLAAIDRFDLIAPSSPDVMRNEVVRSDILATYRQPGSKFHFQKVAAR